ncbi:helix-turn-helix transcriptional regulator [Geomonas azotofigens]|uniref:helix-turn-helix transcriptional regulator n=1 Tax=Geomonas azotofigens TaxID=2843196 RepID=UPI001C1154CF|nr:AlpA family phage regulatory protein [Geomonas azotofigens]MBU5613918.1 AlpA family phage regulatory protein [Geomonas azotofigens]
MSERLLRLKKVLSMVPVSRTTWYAGIKSRKFPPGRLLTERTRVWDESSIIAVVNGTWTPEGDSTS